MFSRRIVSAIAVAGLLALGACGSDGSGTDSNDSKESSKSDSSPSELLPAAIRESGVITIGASASYPPYFFKNDKDEYAGVTKEVMEAAADELNVDVKWLDTSFEVGPQSIKTGRIDAWTGPLQDTVEREKTLDIVDYFKQGFNIVVKEGNPKNISGWDDLCGKKVAAGKATTAGDLAKDISKECVADGEDKVDLDEVPYSSVMLQVLSGKSDAMLSSYATTQALIDEDKGFEATGEQRFPYYQGVAVKKGSDELVKALMAGLKAVMSDGRYTSILKDANLPEMSLEEPILNGTTTKPLD